MIIMILLMHARILKILHYGDCQMTQNAQRFRVTPSNLQIVEGSEALLQCEVSNLAGQVQWTKDGFALGFVSGHIPGFPRFATVGDKSQGVYNLKITNASIDDDAEYQCQVTPAKFHSAIRANAKLTVIDNPPYNHKNCEYTKDKTLDLDNVMQI
uniref:CSON005483 protein n=1 Tax=Culicoides sonorensis TaxID=179676 RepID=A0A336L8S8_CULSO